MLTVCYDKNQDLAEEDEKMQRSYKTLSTIKINRNKGGWEEENVTRVRRERQSIEEDPQMTQILAKN